MRLVVLAKKFSYQKPYQYISYQLILYYSQIILPNEYCNYIIFIFWIIFVTFSLKHIFDPCLKSRSLKFLFNNDVLHIHRILYSQNNKLKEREQQLLIHFVLHLNRWIIVSTIFWITWKRALYLNIIFSLCTIKIEILWNMVHNRC